MALSSNDGCGGKAVTITCCECVCVCLCVALGIQRAKRVDHTVLSSVAYPALQYFPNCLIKDTIL